MDQEIIDYILKAQKHGLADMEIKQNLLNAGWDADAVEQNFIFARAEETHTGAGSEFSAPAGYRDAQTPNFSQRPAAFQNTQTTISISEKHFQKNSPGAPVYKNKIFWAVLCLLAVLGASAFGYYTYFYASPQAVLNKFFAAQRPQVYQSDYAFSYSYADASSTKPITVTFSGTAYQNTQNASTSESSNVFTLGLASPAASGSINLQYLILNNVLYFDVGNISQFKSLGADWIKLDLGQLQNYLNSRSTTTGQSLQNLLANQQLKAKLENLAANSKIIAPENFLAKETIKGVPAYHLKITMDSKVLGQTIAQAIDLIQSDPGFTGQKLTQDQENAVGAFFAKFVLKQGDLWIGQKDSQLYQMHLSLSAPSVQDLSGSDFANSVPALDQSLEKKRDATRLSDSRQLEQALQLYYNDHGGYPAGKMGVPQGLIPGYILSWPAAPTPLDGTCTDYFNGYWYKNKGTAFTKNGITLYPSFTLTFCLGRDTGGYAAGIGMVTPQGMAGNVACPATPELCVNSNPAAPADLQAQINKLQFNSTLTFDDTFYNFGKVQTLQAPANPVDLMQMLEGYFSSIGGAPKATSVQ